MTRKFDLLGDPIPDNHGNPGANGHTPTGKTIKKVRVLLAAGVKKSEIAKELGLSMPTLTKHYFKNGRLNMKAAQQKARDDQRAMLMLRLEEAVDKGNVTAIKEMRRILDEEDRAALAKDLAKAPKALRAERPLPKGKKEAMEANAAQAWDDNPLFSGRPH